MCLMISVYFLVDKLRRLIAYDRQSSVNVTDDWRTFSDKSLSIGTSNLSGVGIIVDCPMLPAGALVANTIIHSNSTLGRYTGMYYAVTYWGPYKSSDPLQYNINRSLRRLLPTDDQIDTARGGAVDGYVTLPILPTIAVVGLRSSGAAGEG